MAGKVGGARKGAGRKKGIANTKTRELAEKIMATGLTPVEIMTNVMREQWDLYLTDKSPERARAACEAAKDVAPYMHPRLQAVEVKAAMNITHEQALADLK